MIVFLSIFMRSIGSNYTTQRTYFKDKEKCFLDDGWKKVPTDLYAFTELSPIKTLSVVFLVLFAVVLAFAICVLFWVLQ